ncbi:MAG: pentapeptide repeat-containing protein [bacterium]|nr:pentapeptide repeat-containing protein [bacterium]
MNKDTLQEILEKHDEWLSSEGALGEKAILNNADLSSMSLREVNLGKANLQKINFTGTNLNLANLSGADLSSAALSEADLSGADLRNANLSRAGLSGVDLSGADLSGADLSGADLGDADLSSANLQGVNLCGALFSNTVFTNAELTSLKINISTFERIPGEIRNKYEKTWFFLDSSGDYLNKNHITRSIEFPPQYLSAGVSILNYFASVLREKYPDEKSKVRIDQDGNKVTMIIEHPEGEKEIIEKELNDYGLVVKGDMPIEEFTQDPFLILELKNELRFAQFRIEQQKEMLLLKDSSLRDKDILIDSLKTIISQGVKKTAQEDISIEEFSNAFDSSWRAKTGE